MSDSDPAPPPAAPATTRISDRAALEAAIAGAAGLLLGRVLLGRGVGLLAGTAAIAARLVSEALKHPQPETPGPTGAPPIPVPPDAKTPERNPLSLVPPSPQPAAAGTVPLSGVTDPLLKPEAEDGPAASTAQFLETTQEAPELVEVEDVGLLPESANPAESAFPFTAAAVAEAVLQEPVETLFVELPAADMQPTAPGPAPHSAAQEFPSLPLPAFPAWEAFSAPTPVPETAAIPEMVSPHASIPASPSSSGTTPLPAFPGITELTDPEAIWKMAAAESAPVPEAATAAPTPSEDPFAALFASSNETPEALPAGQADAEIAPTGIEEEPSVLPEPFTASAPAPEAESPSVDPTTAPIPSSLAPGDLPLLSLKLPSQTPSGATAPVSVAPNPNLTAPIEIVEAAEMEGFGVPPPRQAGHSVSAPSLAPAPQGRSAWKAWLIFVLIAGAIALFYWNELRKTAPTPVEPPATAPSLERNRLPASSSTPPLPVTPAPAAPEKPPVSPQPVPNANQTQPGTAPPAAPPATVPKPVSDPNPPPTVAIPSPGAPPKFPAGSPEALALQTLETLLAARTVQELAPLVHQPAEAARQASHYLPDGNLKPIAYQQILFDAEEPVSANGFKSRLFRVVTETTPLGFPVAVDDTKDGPRVDFDAFIQCRDRLLDGFMTRHSALPGRFLVVLRRGHYFGEDLKPEELDRLLCLEVSSPLPDSPKYPVFIPRSTELGRVAQRKFAWDQVYTPVVELSHSDTYVSLNAILQDTWQRTIR